MKWDGETTDKEGVEEAEAHLIINKVRVFWKEHFERVGTKNAVVNVKLYIPTQQNSLLTHSRQLHPSKVKALTAAPVMLQLKVLVSDLVSNKCLSGIRGSGSR